MLGVRTADTAGGGWGVCVPRITVYFWLTKALTTAMGEATSDYLVHTMDPVLAVCLGFVAFGLVLALQLSRRRYVAWSYWLAVVMVGVFGTMAADVVHVVLAFPYLVSSVMYAAALAAVFVLWQRTEGTVSFHSVDSPRRQAFYWAAVTATFAMGTALGDMAAITMHLGYFPSMLVFAVVICIPAIGYWRWRMNAVLAFWFAYVVTRPLGASFADWTGKSPLVGGLGYGDGRVALLLTGAIACLVAYLALTRLDEPAAAPRRFAAGSAP